MRWKFPDEADRREARDRAKVIKAIEKWWLAFEKKADDCDALFHGRMQWDLPAFMHRHLGAVSPLLMWEFGPGKRGGHRLAITPEHRHHLRPLTEAVLERAPKLKGWSFVGHRPPPESMEWAVQSVTAKGGGDVSRVRAQARRGDHNCIDLTFTSPAYTQEDGDDDFRDALWLAEGLLGEEVFNRWVGFIRTVPGKGGRSLPLDRVQATVNALVQSAREQLPAEPCGDWTEETQFTQWELLPDRGQDDYPGQSDLIVASSMRPDVWEAAHSGRYFWSGRFSRHGETFAYLKIGGERRPEGEEAAYRQAIEDDVRRALVKGRLGSTLGGGSGLRYCYIDVALRNVKRAVPALRKVIAKHDVPPRAWLLFHDDDLRAEWVPLADGAPAPPLDVEEE